MTPKQRDVLDYVRQYYDQHGRAPSVRNISSHFQIVSPSGTHRALQRLHDLGYLEKVDDSAGCYVPSNSGARRLAHISTQALRAELGRREANNAR